MKNKRMEEMIKLALDSGLDPFPVVFEVVERATMNNVVAYGLPTRARHWSYGRAYDHQKTYGEMGFSKIYEVILNNNPSYAFMLDTNSEVQNLFITGHCIGHSHFFKNNCMFKNTDKNMIHHAAEHAGRIEDYIERYGFEKVEHLMDIGFALDDHIDTHKGMHRKPYENKHVRLHYLNPGEFDDLGKRKNYVKREVVNGNFPPHPEKDLLWFLINYAPLEEWEKDVLDIIREEAFYFYPQKMTKILNEGWACVCPQSLIFLPNVGLVSGKDVVDKKYKYIMDGAGEKREITNYYSSSKKCKTIATKKGYNISGATQHRVIVWKNGKREWKNIGSLNVGDLVEIRCNQNCWGNKYHEIDFSIFPKKGGVFRDDIDIPSVMDEDFAKFLGYFSSEGNFGHRCITITNGDKNVVNDIVKCIKNSFGIDVVPKKDGSRWRINIYSVQVIKLLEYLNTGTHAKNKKVPSFIMTSPKSVVISYLSSLFTGDGGAYENSILCLSSSSYELISSVQMLLLNMGVFTSISTHKKYGFSDNYHLTSTHPIFGKRFANLVKTSNRKKSKSLSRWSSNNKEFGHRDRVYLTTNEYESIAKLITNERQRKLKVFGINEYFIDKNHISKEQLCRIEKHFPQYVLPSLKKKLSDDYMVDEIVKVSDVFVSPVVDFTVDETHSYQCQGFINHNSYWHAELMYNFDLTPEEHMDFARDHEKVVQPGGNPFRINPYFLGYKIFKDIEKRWDKKYGVGSGKKKIFEVAAEEDDISFLRNYLTSDLVEELKLFTYGYKQNYPKDWNDIKLIEVKERLRDEVVESMVQPLYNGGAPKIVITEIGHEGELILKHDSEELGTLDHNFAKKTIEYIWDLWAAPVELHTKDDDGSNIAICFDEAGAYIKDLDESLSFDDEEEEDLEKAEPKLVGNRIIIP